MIKIDGNYACGVKSNCATNNMPFKTSFKKTSPLYKHNSEKFEYQGKYADGSDKKLQDPKFFERLYSGKSEKTDEEIHKLFGSKEAIKSTMSDPKVMLASTKGLLKNLELQFKKAYEKGDKAEYEKLAIAIAGLYAGLASLENAAGDVVSYKTQPMPLKQIAFAGIFNYGVGDWLNNEKATGKKKAEQITNRYATLAAATAGTLAQVGPIEAALLTVETKQMCKKIFRAYNRAGGWTAALGATAAGFVAGTSLANAWLGAFPGAGNAANATITYGLHQLTGRACMMYCDSVPASADKTISEYEAKAKFIMKIKNQIQLTFAGSELVYEVVYKICDTLL